MVSSFPISVSPIHVSNQWFIMLKYWPFQQRLTYLNFFGLGDKKGQFQTSAASEASASFFYDLIKISLLVECWLVYIENLFKKERSPGICFQPKNPLMAIQ